MPETNEIFNDGVLSATLVNGWIALFWITNDRGYLSKQMIKDVLKIEQSIKHMEVSARGWVCHSEHDHKGMHRVIERMGGVKFNQDEEGVFFSKEIPCAVAEKRQHWDELQRASQREVSLK